MHFATASNTFARFFGVGMKTPSSLIPSTSPLRPTISQSSIEPWTSLPWTTISRKERTSLLISKFIDYRRVCFSRSNDSVDEKSFPGWVSCLYIRLCAPIGENFHDGIKWSNLLLCYVSKLSYVVNTQESKLTKIQFPLKPEA